LGMKQPIAGHERRQHERLEKPRGVRQVPLDRTGVWHRLDNEVFRRQGLAQGLRSTASDSILFAQSCNGIRDAQTRGRHGCIRRAPGKVGVVHPAEMVARSLFARNLSSGHALALGLGSAETYSIARMSS